MRKKIFSWILTAITWHSTSRCTAECLEHLVMTWHSMSRCTAECLEHLVMTWHSTSPFTAECLEHLVKTWHNTSRCTAEYLEHHVMTWHSTSPFTAQCLGHLVMTSHSTSPFTAECLEHLVIYLPSKGGVRSCLPSSPQLTEGTNNSWYGDSYSTPTYRTLHSIGSNFSCRQAIIHNFTLITPLTWVVRNIENFTSW